MKIAKILLVIFSLALVCALCLAVFRIAGSSNGNRALTLFGMQARIVKTSSMERSEQTDVDGYRIKDIRAGAVILLKTVPKNAERANAFYGKLRVGDVLTFHYAEYGTPVVITHRVVAIEEKATGGYLIGLEGDNKGEDANVLTQQIDTAETESGNAVIGKVIGQSYLLGRALVFLRRSAGILALALILVILFPFLKKQP